MTQVYCSIYSLSFFRRENRQKIPTAPKRSCLGLICNKTKQAHYPSILHSKRRGPNSPVSFITFARFFAI